MLFDILYTFSQFIALNFFQLSLLYIQYLPLGTTSGSQIV